MTMTPDQCFNQMALLLNMPEDSGYEGILENLKFLKEQNKEISYTVEDTLSSMNFYIEANKELKQEIKKLKEENTKLAKDFVNVSRPRQTSPPRSIQEPDVVLRLKREIDKLKKDIERLSAADESLRFMGWTWAEGEWVQKD